MLKTIVTLLDGDDFSVDKLQLESKSGATFLITQDENYKIYTPVSNIRDIKEPLPEVPPVPGSAKSS